MKVENLLFKLASKLKNTFNYYSLILSKKILNSMWLRLLNFKEILK